MDTEKVTKFFDSVMKWLPLVEKSIAGSVEHFKWGMDKVRGFVADKRDPSDEDWAELHSRRDALGADLMTD